MSTKLFNELTELAQDAFTVEAQARAMQQKAEAMFAEIDRRAEGQDVCVDAVICTAIAAS